MKINFIKKMVAVLRSCLEQFKNQSNYQIVKVDICKKTEKHLIQIKITNKGQSMSYLAETIAADDNLIAGFSPLDIRSIIYFATCDKYEKILADENIKKSYEILRSDSIDGNKAIKIRNKTTGEYRVILLKDFFNSDLIVKLNSFDAYQIGYLAGQEQGVKDISRLKIIRSKTS